MINPLHLRELVVGPVLASVHAHTRELEQLVMELGHWETTLCNLWSNEEMDNPTGMGLWGVTLAEHHDIVRWMNRQETWTRAWTRVVPKPDAVYLGYNLAYACLVAAALLHIRVPDEERWPTTVEGRWRLWERYWVGEEGFRTLDQYRWRVRMLAIVEEPVCHRAQRRHRPPRAADIPGRLVRPRL